MLGKLIKHEFKAQYKLYGAMYLFALVLSIFNFGLHFLSDKFPNAPVFTAGKTIALFLFVLTLIAIFVGTLIFSILRYRKNLLKDEGYLMHTLPVKAWNHVFTKLLVTAVWYVLDICVAMLTVGISVGSFKLYKDLWKFFDMSDLDRLGTGGMALVIAIIIVSAVLGMMQFFFSLTIGYTSYSSKDLMSFVAYIITYLVNQLISAISLVIVCLMHYNTIFVDENLIDLDATSTGFAKGMLIAAFIVSIVMFVVYYIMTVRILDNKLNLE